MPRKFTEMTVTVAELIDGDLVDLEGDQYADPEHNHDCYDLERLEVLEMTVETPYYCTLVYFDGATVGFPPDHKLKILRPR